MIVLLLKLLLCTAGGHHHSDAGMVGCVCVCVCKTYCNLAGGPEVVRNTTVLPLTGELVL